jgi:hypothetical protein
MSEFTEENGRNTDKFDNFLKALRELCVAHNIVLSGSDHDCLRVRDREMDDDPIDALAVENHTSGLSLSTEPESK